LLFKKDFVSSVRAESIALAAGFATDYLVVSYRRASDQWVAEMDSMGSLPRPTKKIDPAFIE
jgi:hypothetical protein